MFIATMIFTSPRCSCPECWKYWYNGVSEESQAGHGGRAESPFPRRGQPGPKPALAGFASSFFCAVFGPDTCWPFFPSLFSNSVKSLRPFLRKEGEGRFSSCCRPASGWDRQSSFYPPAESILLRDGILSRAPIRIFSTSSGKGFPPRGRSPAGGSGGHPGEAVHLQDKEFSGLP